MGDIRELWTCVERWVDADPALPSSEVMFGPPATGTEMGRAEEVLGHRFSESFRSSLLIHDGQIGNTGWLPHGMYLLPLRRIVACWQEEREWEQGFQLEDVEEDTGEFDHIRDIPTVIDAGRVPIAEQSGSSMYLDFVPGPAGNPGQVIFTKNECSFVLAGETFGDFLATYVSLLELGCLRFEADRYHSVIPADPHATWDDLFRSCV